MPDCKFTACVYPAWESASAALGPRLLPSPQYTTIGWVFATSMLPRRAGVDERDRLGKRDVRNLVSVGVSRPARVPEESEQDERAGEASSPVAPDGKCLHGFPQLGVMKRETTESMSSEYARQS